MCSIIGFKVKTVKNHQDNVEDYLKILEERGDQSFGYFYITKAGKIFYAKALSLTPLLNDIKEIPENSWCFLHARKASAGMTGVSTDDKLARAHPVESDDGKILLLHNGTKTSIKDTVKGSLSDSQGLATLLSIMWEKRAILAREIGVVIYQKGNGIYLYKDGMRPLVMSEDKTIFASEPISDKVKWCNIKSTTSSDGDFDIKLDFKKEGLGIEVDEPIEITFKLAERTIKNFSVEGMPKTSTCITCKKKHIDNDDDYRRCCTCTIEKRKTVVTTTTYGHNTTKNISSKVIVAKKPTTKETIVAQIPSRESTVLVGKNGIVRCSNISKPSAAQVEIFTSDVNILKSLGYNNVIWKGWAIVKANIIYKSTNGALFVPPQENGTQNLKVDRVFVDKASPACKQAYSTITNKTLYLLGELDNSSVYVIKHDMDISTGVREVNTGMYKLETFVMPTGFDGKLDRTEGSLVGFRTFDRKEN